MFTFCLAVGRTLSAILSQEKAIQAFVECTVRIIYGLFAISSHFQDVRNRDAVTASLFTRPKISAQRK